MELDSEAHSAWTLERFRRSIYHPWWRDDRTARSRSRKPVRPKGPRGSNPRPSATSLQQTDARIPILDVNELRNDNRPGVSQAGTPTYIGKLEGLDDRTHAPVAQRIRASHCGCEGQRFESSRAYHERRPSQNGLAFSRGFVLRAVIATSLRRSVHANSPGTRGESAGTQSSSGVPATFAPGTSKRRLLLR